jgi:hypothetical protein
MCEFGFLIYRQRLRRSEKKDGSQEEREEVFRAKGD